MSNPLISKSRRIRFALHLTIHDLNNVPLVSGASYIKWHLPSSTAAEHRGRTPKCAIKDHRVLYDYTKVIPVRMVVGKDGVLQSTEVELEVEQEYSSGGRAERIKLGVVRVNLAEYCSEEGMGLASPQTPGGGIHAADAEEKGVVRRYLMQESKINSTLKLGILMKHLEGTRDYIAPPLRTAPVFGGIAGIISSSEPASTTHGVASHVNADAHSTDDALPNLSISNKEAGEMQDMYRRTLAAYWASYPGELRADECIEDIFAGGDGWGKNGRPATLKEQEQSQEGSGSGSSTPNPDVDGSSMVRSPGKDRNSGRFVNVGGVKFAQKHEHMRRRVKGAGEIDEFDLRDDLKSWVVGEKAYG
jgi:hypothetical protein